jgi:hypothetical protein
MAELGQRRALFIAEHRQPRPNPASFAITVSIRVRDGAAGEIQTMVHACVSAVV